MRVVRTVLIFVLLIAAVPGCDSDVKPAGPGDACKVPGDCTDGLICVRGACRELLRGIGEPCNFDGQCLENNCLNGVCCSESCRVGCSGYECIGANGTGCVNAGSCQSGYCVDGRCCESACDGSCRTCDGEVPGACEPDPAPGCITGSIAVRVAGVSRDISVVISGPQQYHLTTSGGEIIQAGAPGGTYSVECQDLKHYAVSVDTQDDTIDSDGELISFSCVYTTVAPPGTGFIEVNVTGHLYDVLVYIRGPDDMTATYKSSGGSVEADDIPPGTYEVECEELSGYRYAVDTDDDTIDFTGELIVFNCRYEIDPHWMAVGEGGQILWSEDAVGWIEHIPPLGDHNLIHAAHGNGMLIIIGDEVIFTSIDMVTWNAVPLPDTLSRYTSVLFAEDRFLMTDSRGKVWLSADGSSWVETGPGDVNLIAEGIAYGGGRYVVVGREYSLHGSVTYYSDDLETWINTSPNGNGLNAVTWGLGNFIAVGEAGQGWWSPDGGETAWQEITADLGRGDLLDVGYGWSRFVAVGSGFQWTYAATPTSWRYVSGCGGKRAVGYGSGTFIAVGNSACGCFSYDAGRTWEGRCLAGDDDLNDVIYLH